MGLMQIKMLSTPLLPMLSLLYRYHFVFDDPNFLPLGIFIKLGILMIYIFPDNMLLTSFNNLSEFYHPRIHIVCNNMIPMKRYGYVMIFQLRRTMEI
ncbi:unnamed protein product [Schistosoma intercalatum]|nr:unnamed protein product [Schistosoma intercalatum]